MPRMSLRHLLGEPLTQRLQDLPFRDAGHGYDALGMHPRWVQTMVGLTRPLYERYFRVTHHGLGNVPTEGPVVLAANHSGLIPLDAAMLWADLVRGLSPARVPRVVTDVFVPQLPFVWTLFSRVGAVAGNRATVRGLLEAGEMLVIFPEGTPGIAKPFRDRYKLAPWRVGHAELALRHQAPVVPVAIVGAEEQWPLLTKIDAHVFGAPFVPVPLTPLPLPVHYHVYYGEPLRLHTQCSPSAADDPEIAEEAAALVREAVEGLIRRGLAERPGVFR